MQQLPNNCRIGKISVFPSNWKTVSANKDLIWRVTYWFYDDNLKQKKQVVIKGMNRVDTLAEKQRLIKLCIDTELRSLQVDCFNPITDTSIVPIDIDCGINPNTPLIEALNKARTQINTCMADLKSVIKYTEKAARKLNMDKLPVGQVKRRHIKLLLTILPEVKDYWSKNTFNYYRAHLLMLFAELLQYDAVEYNPVVKIQKAKETIMIRETLSRKQRKEVDQHLRKLKLTRFRLFCKLFFHSGIRITEMLRLKGKHADLDSQLLKCLIKKGRQWEEKQKPIKNIAIRYWKFALAGCGPEDYIFSRILKPGKGNKNGLNIKPEVITRMWAKYVKAPKDKGGLGIDIGFYPFKHANTTEMVDRLGEEDAAELNSHKGTAMVRKIYDTKQVSRQQVRIMGADNEF